MQFLYQPLTWGFLLVLVPLLIHLINLMRQRRVEWAAMDFLIQAHKKHRKWIWLKQFLLLAARMLAVAILVAMLAHLVSRSQWSGLFGGVTRHHIVLLDDSYSMADELGATSAFDRAAQVIARLSQEADTREALEKFTLIRFSKAERGGHVATSSAESPDSTAVIGSVADLAAVPLDGRFAELLEAQQKEIAVSPLASGPERALEMAAEIIAQSPNERSLVYVISDFRAKDWSEIEEISQLCQRMESQDAQINFVRCVDDENGNLGIVSVAPAPGSTMAAGVPLFFDVAVKNTGGRSEQQVPIVVKSLFYGDDARSPNAGNTTAVESELPALLIDQIEPGETVTRRVQVFFPTAGRHVVQAELGADPVAWDNRRWSVLDFPTDIPVLVIDGDPQQQNANYLSIVFRPSERVQTGIRAVKKPVSFLRDKTPEELDAFHVVYLLDVPRLDAAAQQNLEGFVARGGGLAVFLGPNAETAFYNQWYDEGRGLYPVPLDRMDIVPPTLGNSQEFIVEEHPIFRVLLGERNPFASQVRIQQYFRSSPRWQPADESTTRVLARLNNQHPVVVERTWGRGRMVTMLSTLAPIWNTWAMQPTFVVVLLEMQAHLDQRQSQVVTRPVGASLEVAVDADRFQPEVEFFAPTRNNQRQAIIRQAVPVDPVTPRLLQATLGDETFDQLEGAPICPAFMRRG